MNPNIAAFHELKVNEVAERTWKKREKCRQGKDILYSCRVYLGAAPARGMATAGWRRGRGSVCACTFSLRSLIINNVFLQAAVRARERSASLRTFCGGQKY